MATEAEKSLNMFGVDDIARWIDGIDDSVTVKCEGKIAGYRAVAFSILSDAQTELSMCIVNNDMDMIDRARQTINRAKYLLRMASENETKAMEDYINAMGATREFPRRVI